MTREANWSCALLGVGFLLLGIINALGIVTSWQLGGALHWIFFFYAALNLIIAYGFFAHQYWVFPALVANLAGNVLLVAARLFDGAATDRQITLYILALCFNALLVLIVYRIRKRLRRDTVAHYAGAIFLVLWTATIGYTLIRELL